MVDISAEGDSTDVLGAILEPLRAVPPDQLRKVISELVQRGGEYTACGKALKEAYDFLHPGEGAQEPRPPMGFDSAYGSTTFPLEQDFTTVSWE